MSVACAYPHCKRIWTAQPALWNSWTVAGTWTCLQFMPTLELSTLCLFMIHTQHSGTLLAIWPEKRPTELNCVLYLLDYAGQRNADQDYRRVTCQLITKVGFTQAETARSPLKNCSKWPSSGYQRPVIQRQSADHACAISSLSGKWQKLIRQIKNCRSAKFDLALNTGS